jgi:hypothetical protein
MIGYRQVKRSENLLDLWRRKMKKIIGLILKEKGNKSVSIIGAGDGPTSVFLAGKIGRDYSVFTFIIGIILFVIAVVIYFKHKH